MAFCSAKLDEVSRNKIVEEAIRREERAANGRMATDFQVPDPRKSELKHAWQKAAADVLFSNRQAAVTCGAISILFALCCSADIARQTKLHYSCKSTDGAATARSS